MGEWYEGPVEVGQVFTCPDNSGEYGYRRVRVLARHPDDPTRLIIEDRLARMHRRPIFDRHPHVCPEFNLRMVFVPECAFRDCRNAGAARVLHITEHVVCDDHLAAIKRGAMMVEVEANPDGPLAYVPAREVREQLG